jgi:endonuclease I
VRRFLNKRNWNNFCNLKFIPMIGLLIQFSYSIENIIIEPNLTEYNLSFYIQQNFTAENIPNYDNSRDIIFGTLDNENSQILCVYSGYSINLIGGYCNCENGSNNCNETDSQEVCNNNSGNWIFEDDPSVEAYYKGLNVEHTWPQSKGAEYGNPKSDLHHLFPTKSNINSSRGNDPFDEIPDAETHKWYRDSEILFEIPQLNINDYSEKLNPDNQPYAERFEPKEDHKGNVARAMFYFYAIYKDSADVDFWNIQKSVLLNWHYSDPVDELELNRTEQIATFQDNIKNPFVLDSTLARRIWYYHENAGNTQVSFNIQQTSVEESNTELQVQIEIINPSIVENTTIQINIGNGSLSENEFELSETNFTFYPENDSNLELTINLNDDDIYEGLENLILEIEILSGDEVIIGSPGTFTLYIEENDFPKVTITEVMINPQNISDANGEWFEIYVDNQIPINFKNWIIKDNDTDDYLILEHIIIPQNTYSIFANNGNLNTNGSVETMLEYDGLNLANGGDELILISPEGFIADSIWWDGGNQFPFGNGKSMALLNINDDNTNAENWQQSDLEFSSGDFGTPGLENCFNPNEYDECGVCGGNGQTCNQLLGDVNLDGNINVVDVVVLVGFILENETPNPDQFYTSDLNQDLALNIVDIVQIVGIILSN